MPDPEPVAEPQPVAEPEPEPVAEREPRGDRDGDRGGRRHGHAGARARPGAPRPTAPSVNIGNVPSSIASEGIVVNVSATAVAGVRQLDVFLGNRKVCTLTKAPYTCKVQPKGTDVGKQSLRVVVTDLNGSSAESKRNVVVVKFAAKGLTLAAKSTGSRTAISGKLRLPAQVGMAEGCASGSVTLIVKRGSKVIDNSQVKLNKTCGFRKTVSSRSKGKLSVSASFGGNKVIAAVKATRRFS